MWWLMDYDRLIDDDRCDGWLIRIGWQIMIDKDKSIDNDR